MTSFLSVAPRSSSHHLVPPPLTQVRADYDRLKQTFAVVIQERDEAEQQRRRLQDKVESLEQLLKVTHADTQRSFPATFSRPSAGCRSSVRLEVMCSVMWILL